jgi:hypothetical protein
MKPRTIGLAVILVANAFALGGVALNRMGEPESQLVLSQRELRLLGDHAGSENSGVSMELNWCLGDSAIAYDTTAEEVMYSGRCSTRTPRWLNAERLREIGFDTSIGARDPRAERYYTNNLSRPALVVLELGSVWHEREVQNARAFLATREAALAKAPDSSALKLEVSRLRRRVSWIDRGKTRLYLVDVGASVERLRAKYPDRSRFVILPATIRARLERSPSGNDSVWVGGEINTVIGAEVNVPAKDQSLVRDAVSAYRYEDGLPAVEKNIAVTMAFGRRLEPWIRSVARIK